MTKKDYRNAPPSHLEVQHPPRVGGRDVAHASLRVKARAHPHGRVTEGRKTLRVWVMLRVLLLRSGARSPLSPLAPPLALLTHEECHKS